MHSCSTRVLLHVNPAAAHSGLSCACPRLAAAVQVVADTNQRIQDTVASAAKAADNGDAHFDVPSAMTDISQVAAVQQDAMAKQVASLAADVAASPTVANTTLQGIKQLKQVCNSICLCW